MTTMKQQQQQQQQQHLKQQRQQQSHSLSFSNKKNYIPYYQQTLGESMIMTIMNKVIYNA